MSTSIMDLRLHEEMAGAVLKQVAALEPAERLWEAHWLTHIMGQAVKRLEELWEDLRQRLQSGVSPSDAATFGRILTRSANLISCSLELLARESPSLEKFREDNVARLERIKARSASLRHLVEIPAPASDPERLGRSLEQMERNEGIDAGDLLAEVRGS
jgi:hypothetical protein